MTSSPPEPAGAAPSTEPNAPLISVVTPSLNRAAFLEGNIRSVLDQGFPEFEHIVVDGGSTDGTMEILRRHAHIRWTSEPDRGMSHALNKGFRKSRGEIIAWLATDDRFERGAFRTAASLLLGPNAHKVIFGDARQVDVEGRWEHLVRGHPFRHEDLVRFWAQPHFLCQPAVLFRRELFDEFGYLDEENHRSMDYEFWLRVRRRYAFHYVPQVLAIVLKHEDCVTAPSQHAAVRAEMLAVSKRYWGPKGSPSYIARWSSYHGERSMQRAYEALRDGHTLRSLGLLGKAIACRPLNLARVTWWSILARALGAGRMVDALKGSSG